jgi:hypothetical protein
VIPVARAPEDDLSLLAGMPALLGYRPEGSCTITMVGEGRRLLTTFLLDAVPGDPPFTSTAAFDPAAVRVVAALWPTPASDPAAAQAEAAAAAGAARRALDAAGCTAQLAVYTVSGSLVTRADEPLTVRALPAAGADPFAAAAARAFGPPAANLVALLDQHRPAPGALRDAIADAMPAAAGYEQALALPAPELWRRGAARDVLRALGGGPWSGPSAAAALLWLSDPLVLDTVVGRLRAAGGHPHPSLPVDPDLLRRLAVQAPPDLIAPAAAALAAFRLGAGQGTAPVAAALAQLAAAEMPGRLRPRDALEHLVHRPWQARPEVWEPPVLRHAYPDPYAGHPDADPLLPGAPQAGITGWPTDPYGPIR